MLHLKISLRAGSLVRVRGKFWAAEPPSREENGLRKSEGKVTSNGLGTSKTRVRREKTLSSCQGLSEGTIWRRRTIWTESRPTEGFKGHATCSNRRKKTSILEKGMANKKPGAIILFEAVRFKTLNPTRFSWYRLLDSRWWLVTTSWWRQRKFFSSASIYITTHIIFATCTKGRRLPHSMLKWLKHSASTSA